jgi:NIPSNAP
MQRRKFLQATALSVPVTLSSPFSAPEKKQSKQCYELRVYDCVSNDAVEILNGHLASAFIPAMNRLGSTQVGVFRENGKPENHTVWVLITHASVEAYAQSIKRLKADTAFQSAAADYHKIPKNAALFTRYSTSLLDAFDVMPVLKAPAKEPRVLELRTYEGYSEDAVRRKVKMFNTSEVPIFLRAGLVPVFFGEVIAGPEMPCLTYMLMTKDVPTRDAGWKAFQTDPEWKTISAMQEYADSVSKVVSTILEPLSSSQI